MTELACKMLGLLQTALKMSQRLFARISMGDIYK